MWYPRTSQDGIHWSTKNGIFARNYDDALDRAMSLFRGYNYISIDYVPNY